MFSKAISCEGYFLSQAKKQKKAKGTYKYNEVLKLDSLNAMKIASPFTDF